MFPKETLQLTWFERHSMIANWVIAAVLVAGVISGHALASGDSIVRAWLGFARALPIAACIVMPLAEWIAHRYFMHRKAFGFGKFYRVHHIEHHGKEVNLGWHIDLSAWHHHKVTLPVFVGLALMALYVERPGMGGGYAIGTACALSVTFLGHSWIWTAMHRGIHGVERNLFDRWITQTRIYRRWLRHHEAHHRRPNRNYGVVYSWPDRIFRTLEG